MQLCKTKIEWLGFKLTSSGISPINTKVQGISDILRPTSLKELRSSLGAVNQFNRFVPDLATICFPFRLILKRDAKWNWNEEHESAFKRVNEEVKKVAELKHFKKKKTTANNLRCEKTRARSGSSTKRRYGLEANFVCIKVFNGT